MGSQTLEILRQGVWASLTGGWFYDPHQGVFCNVVHLYLWLFLLCSPFVTYLYFPGTCLTWYIYCLSTSLTVLIVKLINMTLHRLYDRAQTNSEANLKNPFFKVTKETETCEDETGIEMKVIRNDGLQNSVEHDLHEPSEGNSILSMENMNSIIDLKVDVHRKNSSESIEFMFYTSSMLSANSAGIGQQEATDQQLTSAKSCVINNNNNNNNSSNNRTSYNLRTSSSASCAAIGLNNNYININNNYGMDKFSKYLAVYPEHEAESPTNIISNNNNNNQSISRDIEKVDNINLQPRLVRKTHEDFRRRHKRKRLERQSSLNVPPCLEARSSHGRLTRNQSDGSVALGIRNDMFLLSNNNTNIKHSSLQRQQQKQAQQQFNLTNYPTTKANNIQFVNSQTNATVVGNNCALDTRTITSPTTATTEAKSESNNDIDMSSINLRSRSLRSRGMFLPMQEDHHHYNPHYNQHHHHHHHHHHEKQEQQKQQHQQQHSLHISPSGASSNRELTIIGSALDGDEIDMDLGGSASVVNSRLRPLQSWILGSSSDVYLEDDSYTKSEFSIEQIDAFEACGGSVGYHKPYQLPAAQAQSHHRLHRHRHHGNFTIRKGGTTSSSAIQLPVTATVLSNLKHNEDHAEILAIGLKKRRHSNAASGAYKAMGFTHTTSSAFAAAAAAAAMADEPPTVRRIKSAALGINCPRPSVSNLSPHPNSVEAISGQQQIKNPAAAILPPPSKCLVRNSHHLNLCSKYGGSFGGGSISNTSSDSVGSLNFGSSASGSTTALLEPFPASAIYPPRIIEQHDEKTANDYMTLNDENIVDKDNGEVTGDGDKVIRINDSLANKLSSTPQLCMNEISNVEHGEPAPVEDDDDPIDDEFKYFDYNIEHILNDLQQTHNELNELELKMAHDDLVKRVSDECKSNELATQSSTPPKSPILAQKFIDKTQIEIGRKEAEAREEEVEEEEVEKQEKRDSLHSTDSEVENNNGSRSPLLSEKHCWLNKNDDKQLKQEIASLQKPKNVAAAAAGAGAGAGGAPNVGSIALNFPQKLFADVRHKVEVDSGCPSSDCEQVSASSKDLLLSADLEQGRLSIQEEESCSPALHEGKSLGAIPKVVKYREVDEAASGSSKREITASNNYAMQLHKRRSSSSGSSGHNQSQQLQQHNTYKNRVQRKSDKNCASSSNSSHSLRDDMLSNDMQRMLWVMHGGGGGGGNGSFEESEEHAINNRGRGVQLYEDMLPPSTQDGMSLSERLFLREVMCCNANKQQQQLPMVAVHTNSLNEQQQINLKSNNSNNNNNNNNSTRHTFGTSVPHNVSNAATLSIQGLMDEQNQQHATRAGSLSVSGMGNASSSVPTAAMLNMDGHHLDNYCDYWRPACLLSADKPIAPKSFYKYHWKLFDYEHDFKICMDRLELLALFDRDLHWLHILFSVTLCALVAYFGANILQLNYYKDIYALLFCAVIAGAQYSLIKSVQPDAASPVHGFNKIVAYSRAIYFCICGGLLLLAEKLRREYHINNNNNNNNNKDLKGPQRMEIFGVQYEILAALNLSIDLLYTILICFPIIFSLGLFPQINTFSMYLLEQLDMHIFGGNAASSLLGAFLCVMRSIMGVLLLSLPLYAALIEERGTQYIVFSIFSAILIPLGYHLARSASDFSHIWILIKTCIVSSYKDEDDDDELSNGSSATDSNTTTNNKHSGISSSGSGRKRGAKVAATSNSEQQNEQIEMISLNKGKIDDNTTSVSRNLSERRSKSKASSLGSSSQTLAGRAYGKKLITASNSFASAAGVENGSVGGGGDNSKFKIINDNNATITTNTVAATTTITATEADDKISSTSTTNAADISTYTGGGLIATTMSAGIPSAGVHMTMCGDINIDAQELDNETPDPLPKKLQITVNTRLKNDLVVMPTLALIIFGLHCSTVFSVLQPDLNIVLYGFTCTLGLLLHYVIPQMRKHMPWLCFARPILRQKEYGQFEVTHAPKVMWFEKFYIYLSLVERNILFPLLTISAVTADAQTIAHKFGYTWGTLILAVCALKFVRTSYSDPTNQYLIVIFTVLFFRIDFANGSETFLIDYFFISIAFRKCCDFFLKLQFIVTYIAPWQITWGSAFHAFAQPFSVPHSAMLFLQACISAILSTPLNPFLGSAIFLTSYVRPIKFWERDYNTRRIDHSNTRLSSQLERDLGADDNNLNSIFYEHLTRSLQHSLCGDLIMGRWGNVNQGDCFVLASDYLNCLVHIIELGNGLCTFQMRGLEFRGTYCQQREVEAITEDVEDNDGCCCYDPGHLPRMLSANAMFSTRWLSWQVVAAQYVLEGYSISDNLASATLQVFEYRKVLITYYIKSIIYYMIKSPKLDQWLASASIQDALQHTLSRQFVDLDPIFNYNLDEDFDFRNVGITRTSFCYVYLSWINFCYDKRKECQQNPTTSQTTSSPTNNNNNTNNNNSNVYNNDCKSTPNLAATVQGSAAKSHSQQQLRTRPQKSATMSGSTTDNNNHSAEHMSTSMSFANISRQTSESAPGLTGASLCQPLESAYSCTFATMGPTVAAKMAAQRHSSNKTTPTRINNNNNNNNSNNNNNNNNSQQSRLQLSTKEETANTNSNIGIDGTSAKPIIKIKVPSVAKDSFIVSLCLALGLLARRALATASHSSLTGVEFFLHGLHALFKGDFRITSPRDEWVFADMELLHGVVAPAVKMALKLQQDHISNPDEFLDPQMLYEAIDTCSKDLVISHEADPVWRSAVLRGAPNLLALRHVLEDGSDEYRIIRLTKRFLSFRVIKLNRECVRGLWAGQQQELIYLRNRNPERGSIQNAKQALRNIINSSCDQPIGYPIYVSPLTTSYADTNEQLCSLIGGAITLDSIKSTLLDCWQRVRERCRQGCSSGSGSGHETIHLGAVSVAPAGSGVGNISSAAESGELYISAPLYNTLTVGNCFGMRGGNVATQLGGSYSGPYGSDSLAVMRHAGISVMPNMKPNSSTLLAGLILREREMEREWETMREARAMRKSYTASLRAGTDRERRATLPIASSSSPHMGRATIDGQGKEITTTTASKFDNDAPNAVVTMDAQGSCSPRFAKISCSSGSLGIGNIITTPGEYPRKSKGPICLTAAAAAASIASSSKALSMPTGSSIRRPRIELNKKVIIVDDLEIYDSLDLLGRIDILWPSEEMRANGGRSGWKGWIPRAGMVGYVVHYWMPNHVDKRRRSLVYLVEIGIHYVPVGECGLREYIQIMDSSSSSAEDVLSRSRRSSSVQYDIDEIFRRQQQQQQHQQLFLQLQQQQQQQREGLTPILGSSVESPTSLLAHNNITTERDHDNDDDGDDDDRDSPMTPNSCNIAVGLPKIKAVSSSSSEDEIGLITLEQQKREMFFNMWKLITENKQQQQQQQQIQSDHITTSTICESPEIIVNDNKMIEDEQIMPTTPITIKATMTTVNKTDDEKHIELKEFEEEENEEETNEEFEEEENEEETSIKIKDITKDEEKCEILELEEDMLGSEKSIDESVSDGAEYMEATSETPQEEFKEAMTLSVLNEATKGTASSSSSSTSLVTHKQSEV